MAQSQHGGELHGAIADLEAQPDPVEPSVYGTSDGAATMPRAIGRSGLLTYEPFYGLADKPFSLSTSPRSLYVRDSHAFAATDLLQAIRRREGVIVLTGGAGTGKTTLCRSVCARLGLQTFAAFVPDPFLTRQDLLTMLLVEFGVVSLDELLRGCFSGASRVELRYRLHAFLTALDPIDARAVLFLNEAQHLESPLLEEVRDLADLDDRGRALLQVVLVGSTALSDALDSPGLRVFAQRVSMRRDLAPLTRAGVSGYVDHRLVTVGGRGDRVGFSDAALDLVCAVSGGVPRVINLICDRALHLGALTRTAFVDEALVAQAVRDLKISDLEISTASPAVAAPSVGEPGVIATDAVTDSAPGSASEAVDGRQSGNSEPGPAVPLDTTLSRDAISASQHIASTCGEDTASPSLVPRRPATRLRDRSGAAAPVSRDAGARLTRWGLAARRERAGSAPAIAVLALTTLGLLGGVGLAVYLVVMQPLVAKRGSVPPEPPVPAPAAPATPSGPTPDAMDGPDTLPPAEVRPADPLPPLAPASTLHLTRSTTAPTATGSPWVIQVGAFSNPERAAAFVQRLLDHHLPAFVRDMQSRRVGVLHVVFVGPFVNRDDADAARRRVRDEHNVPDAYVQPIEAD
jgi:type II secretory pathway predicted ATPase ExeA/cell division septation protein DedD